MNQITQMAYLTDVLQRVVSGRTKAHELHTLLPWTWMPELRAAVLPPREVVAA